MVDWANLISLGSGLVLLVSYSVCCLHIKPLFLSTISVHPVSVLILHPRETNSVVTDCCEREKPKQPQLIKVRQVKC